MIEEEKDNISNDNTRALLASSIEISSANNNDENVAINQNIRGEVQYAVRFNLELNTIYTIFAGLRIIVSFTALVWSPKRCSEPLHVFLLLTILHDCGYISCSLINVLSELRLRRTGNQRPFWIERSESILKNIFFLFFAVIFVFGNIWMWMPESNCQTGNQIHNYLIAFVTHFAL